MTTVSKNGGDGISKFLTRHGLGDWTRTPLAGDASFRRYERMETGTGRPGSTRVLMVAPPPQEDTSAFVAVADHLRRLGLSAPEIHAHERAKGLVLLEDLGDRTFTRELAAGAEADTLYGAAVDVLVHLHGLPADRAHLPALPRYGTALLLKEARLFLDWYLAALLGEEKAAAEGKRFDQLWRRALAPLKDSPPVLVLRDYHVDNLMWLPERAGLAKCGLLDFQDAVLGPAAYDLMSLLEDARLDVADDLAARMLARYMAAFPHLDRERFGTDFALLAAQRHAKVIGIFTRLSHRDGKHAYLAHIPRVWRLLTRALAHPALSEIKAWMDAVLPDADRRVPPAGSPDSCLDERVNGAGLTNGEPGEAA